MNSSEFDLPDSVQGEPTELDLVYEDLRNAQKRIAALSGTLERFATFVIEFAQAMGNLGLEKRARIALELLEKGK